MQISNFSSFFEFFTALNLAYAGSEKFRNIVNDDVLVLKEEKYRIISGIKSYDSFIEVTQSDGNTHVVNLNTKSIFLDRLNGLSAKEETLRFFEESFKPMFLISSFFCLAIILIGGFEQKMLEQDVDWLLIFQNLSLVFVIYIFINSFFSKKAVNKIKPFIVLIIFIVINVFGLIFINYCPFNSFRFHESDQITIYWITIFTAISPYVLHVFRAYLHRLYFRRVFKQFDEEFKRYFPEGLFESTETMIQDMNLGR